MKIYHITYKVPNGKTYTSYVRAKDIVEGIQVLREATKSPMTILKCVLVKIS